MEFLYINVHHEMSNQGFRMNLLNLGFHLYSRFNEYIKKYKHELFLLQIK